MFIQVFNFELQRLIMPYKTKDGIYLLNCKKMFRRLHTPQVALQILLVKIQREAVFFLATQTQLLAIMFPLLSNLKRRSGSAQVEQDPHVRGHASLTLVYEHLRVVLFLPTHSQLLEAITPGSLSNRIRPPKSVQESEGEDGAFENLVGVGAGVVKITGD